VLRKLLVFAILGAIIVTTGCGLRLETGDPKPEEPTVTEQARRSALSAAIEIEQQARSVKSQVEGGSLVLSDEADTAQLGALAHEIELQSQKQQDLLGPPAPSETDSEDPNAKQSSDHSADITVRKLQATIETNAEKLIASLEQAEPEMARLLGSITASMLIWDSRLSKLAAPEGEEGDSASSALGLIPAITEISTPDTQWIPLIVTWDRAAYLLELAAARSGDNRDAFAPEAREYRERAQIWAQALGVVGGDNDPRQATYSTPELTGDFTHDVEVLQEEVRATILEANYLLGDLLYSITPDQRASVVKELAALAADNQRWGIPPALMPGLREQSEALVLN